jgi:formate dehydrogenase beta subunit
VAKVIIGSWQDKLTDNRDTSEELIENSFSGVDKLLKKNRFRAFVGWDGFFIFDPETPVVDMLRAYVQKVQDESCGYCTPCRVGTKVIADRLAAIADGFGNESDLDEIRKTAVVIRDTSMCELGHTSMNALLKAMDLMPEVFEKAIRERRPVERGVYHLIATAPCIEACPAHLDVPRYIDAIRSGNYHESLEIISRRNPLAGICGRVCVHPCESVCRRGELDEPVSIKSLKRFASDQVYTKAVTKITPIKPLPLTSEKRVAVVGAGPAGVTAAFFLRRNGYGVTVFESLKEPGGMSAVGIPDYRLPRNIIETEVNRIAAEGVGFKYGVTVGRDVTLKQLRTQYDAVLLAIGAHGSKSVGMEGEDRNQAGLIAGVTFLRDMNTLYPKGEFVLPEGRHVVVVGGGNVAMDCARSAVRLGYEKVSIVYRRTENEMPADHEEIRDAKLEDVKFHFLTHPTRLETKDGKVVGLTCIKMELGEPDASGRRRPVEVEGSEFMMPCDIVIPAIGQATDFSFISDDFPVKTTKWGTVATDEDTLMSSQDGIFSAGDCVSGPKALIDAMGQGIHAAHSIDLYLRGQKMGLPESELMYRLVKAMDLPATPVDRTGGQTRCYLDQRPVEERVKDFEEIESSCNPEDAIHEAERCLRCYRIAMFVTEE